MLPYILALFVAVGSLSLYLSAFFFPETHRKGDIVFSGVGLFYALVLWVCANRFTGAALLGQTASVALLTWFGWQTLTLRRELVPSDRRTRLGPKAIQQGLGRLLGGLMRLPGELVGMFSRSQPPAVAPPVPPPEGEVTPSAIMETDIPPADLAAETQASPTVTPAAPIAPEPAPAEVPTASADEPDAIPEIIPADRPATEEGEEASAQPLIAPEPDLPAPADLTEVETVAIASTEEPEATDTDNDVWESEATEAPEEGDAQPATTDTSPTPPKPRRDNVFTVLKDALTALSPFKKRPSRPMITLNRPETGDATTVEPNLQAAPEEATPQEAELEEVAPEEGDATTTGPDLQAAPEGEVKPTDQAILETHVGVAEAAAIAAVALDPQETDDGEMGSQPNVAHGTDALAEENAAATEAAVAEQPDAAILEVPEALETAAPTDLGPDGAAAIAVSAEVEVAQSDLDVIDEPIPPAAIDITASPVSDTGAQDPDTTPENPEDSHAAVDRDRTSESENLP